ncbi:hypothetical protein BJF90_14945 [Pseudonocardia sp. CNS-004]|nr:hypothetical protein BJF90_14945 [Pseudonocardia sp. CNS-004]
MAGGSSEPGRSVLDRALAVLGSFTDERPEQSLGEIVAATGLAAATVHRLVAELVAWGALERPVRGRYRIGIRLWQIGALAPLARDLRDADHADLVAALDEIVPTLTERSGPLLLEVAVAPG